MPDKHVLRLPLFEEISAAKKRISEFAIRSPLVPLNIAVNNCSIYLKLENMQPYGSFKIRAGANALLSQDPAQLQKGIFTASAGNFGQGLAAAAAKLGHTVTVYAPDTAARKKLQALEDMRAEIRLLPFDAWWQVMENHGHPKDGGVFIHPVAETSVMAGNGTIGLEILEDLPDTDAILVPFGGGGLSTGIGVAAKHIKPEIRILGCETEAATPLAAAFDQQRPVKVPFDTSTFINGIGSAGVLPEMWPFIQRFVDGAVSASVEETKEALRTLAFKNAVIAEGAGAAPVAAALAGKGGAGKIVCVVSGGNIDAAALAGILSSTNR